MAAITVEVNHVDIKRVFPRHCTGEARFRNALRALGPSKPEGPFDTQKKDGGVTASFFLKTRAGADHLGLLEALSRVPSVKRCSVSAGEADIILEVHLCAPEQVNTFTRYLRSFRDIGEIEVRPSPKA